MKKTFKKAAVFVLAIAVFAMTLPLAMADNFVGYNCITTKEQLNNVRNSLGAKYYLGNDIVFTEADFAPGGAFYNNGEGWQPIGTNGSNAFNGVFDGNGYSIKGLKISVSNKDSNFCGLFGYNLGIINDVDLKDVNISVNGGKRAYVGGICGTTSKRGITNCTVSGKITVSGITIQVVAGGIAGGIYSGYAENCLNSASITIDNSSSINVGGIAGFSGEKIHRCGNIGHISAKGRGDVYGGGIVGNSDAVKDKIANIAITDSYNTGTVYVDTLCDCYVGGIVGIGKGSISRVFNSGAIGGRANTYEYKGKLMGKNSDCEVVDAYYLSDKFEEGEGFTGVTTEQAALQSTFIGLDFNGVWVIKDGIPVLKQFNQVADVPSVEPPVMEPDIIAPGGIGSGQLNPGGTILDPNVSVPNGPGGPIVSGPDEIPGQDYDAEEDPFANQDTVNNNNEGTNWWKNNWLKVVLIAAAVILLIAVVVILAVKGVFTSSRR